MQMEGRKEGRKEGGKEGRKEGRKKGERKKKGDPYFKLYTKSTQSELRP